MNRNVLNVTYNWYIIIIFFCSTILLLRTDRMSRSTSDLSTYIANIITSHLIVDFMIRL